MVDLIKREDLKINAQLVASNPFDNNKQIVKNQEIFLQTNDTDKNLLDIINNDEIIMNYLRVIGSEILEKIALFDKTS